MTSRVAARRARDVARGAWRIAFGSALLLVSISSSASAHSFLVRTSPAAGARLDRAPTEIVLDFSEAVAEPPTLTLRTGGGEPIATLTSDLDQGGTRARADLPGLDRGVFLVAWQVMADDGHTTEGEFAFAVGVTSPAIAATTSGTDISWPDALVGLAVLAGLALAIGGLASHRWILPGEQPSPPVRAAIAIALTGAVARSVLTLDDIHAGWPPGEWSRLADIRPGRFDLALVALLSIAALAVSHRPRPVALAALLASAVVIAVGGHAGDASWWARPATSAHIIVSGAWAGALWHLALVARHHRERPSRLLRDGASRYAGYAVVTAGATLVLGTAAALAQIDRPGQLIDTAYGRVLVLKLVLVVAALLVAFAARRRGLPAAGGRIRVLARLATIESVAVGAVIAASALLAATAPSATATTFVLGPPPIPAPATWAADLAGSTMVAVAAAPDLLQVSLSEPGGQPPRRVDMEIEGVQPDGTEFDIQARSCGPGCATIGHSWHPGQTTLTVSITGGDYADGTAQVSISWPPSPDAGDLLARAVAATRGARRLDIIETLSSGPDATSGPYPISVDGETFIASEPYAAGADDVRALPSDGTDRVITFIVPGSNIWQQLWLDTNDRIVREVLIDPGHRIDRTITYP